MNELAKVMGYKGITSKLSKTIKEMLSNGVIVQVQVNNTLKLKKNN